MFARPISVTFTITALLVVLATPALLGDEPDVLFGVDGRVWSTLEKSDCSGLVKLALLKGIYDGLMFGRSDQIERYQTRKTSYSTLIRGLDKFYSDYRNERVLLVSALQVVALELRGDSPEQVDSLTRAFRDASTTSLPEHPVTHQSPK